MAVNRYFWVDGIFSWALFLISRVDLGVMVKMEGLYSTSSSRTGSSPPDKV